VEGKSKPVPLSKEKAINFCRKCLNEGRITWHGHIKERMNERDISIQDVINIIDYGEIKGEPKYSEKYQNYRYTITGHDIDGRRRTLIISIEEDDEMLELITVYR